MKPARAYLVNCLLLFSLFGSPRGIEAQFDSREAVGQFYRLSPPIGAGRYFAAVQIERVSRLSTAMPPPIDPIPVGTSLAALTGQILELPERQRIYFTAVDAAGVLRLLEIDLLARETRQVIPQPDIGPPYAAFVQAASDASKLYVVWFAPGVVPGTDIYDGMSLTWVGRISEFRPDERAAGFEHRPPYMWALDAASRPVLVDTHRDRVIWSFDHQRLFGPVYGVVADAWQDLLLVRLEVGHDRYHVVDVVSGEIGPPLDLDAYRLAQPRLVLGGRLLVLIDMLRRQPRADRSWAETAVATGGGVVYDLRNGNKLEDFTLIVPREFPVSAVGTNADPSAPGRLWVHVPGDDLRFDFDLPACDRKSPPGDELAAAIAMSWQSGNRLMYRYRISVEPSSNGAVGAVAVASGRATDETGAPAGWGVDLIKRDEWVRWTNGLGPAIEDIAPGTTGSGFVLAAKTDTRPGIVEYRLQAGIGLPRGCESDNRFLENGLKGYTVGPEIVESAVPRRLAQRLVKLVEQACHVGWIDSRDCSILQRAADDVEKAQSERVYHVDRFLQALALANLLNDGAEIVLTDAASAIKEVLELQQ